MDHLTFISFDEYLPFHFPFVFFSTYSSLSLPDVAWNGRWPHQRQCTVCLVILQRKACRQTRSIKPGATIWLCRGLVCQDQRCPPMDPNRSWQTHYCDQSRHTREAKLLWSMGDQLCCFLQSCESLLGLPHEPWEQEGKSWRNPVFPTSH